MIVQRTEHGTLEVVDPDSASFVQAVADEAAEHAVQACLAIMTVLRAEIIRVIDERSRGLEARVAPMEQFVGQLGPLAETSLVVRNQAGDITQVQRYKATS
jgi:hypothetical protein